MAFFDAWRITPVFEHAPGPDTDQWDVDEERTAASQMEHYRSQQETPKDRHAFEISKAAVDALKELDDGLRIQLGGKDCISARRNCSQQNWPGHSRCYSRMALRENNNWHTANVQPV